MKLSASYLILFAVLSVSVYSKLGFDVATEVKDFKCFANANYDWAVIRAYRSIGAVDANANGNLQRARAAGLATDVYMFPCSNPTKISPEQQVDDMIANLDGSSVSKNFLAAAAAGSSSYSKVWVDVETNPSSTCTWTNIASTKDRCTFLGKIVKRLQAKGKQVGIYSSRTMWTEIFGSSTACTEFSTLPMWYARYNNVQNFSDYASLSFGGWAQPYAKQFNGDVTVCSVDCDVNYY